MVMNWGNISGFLFRRTFGEMFCEFPCYDDNCGVVLGICLIIKVRLRN